MRNPTITLKRITDAGGCNVARRKFKKYFGADTRIKLGDAVAQLLRQEAAASLFNSKHRMSKAKLDDILWGFEVFSRATKTDAEKAVKCVVGRGSYSALHSGFEALRTYQRYARNKRADEYTWMRIVEDAFLNNPRRVAEALFPESFRG